MGDAVAEIYEPLPALREAQYEFLQAMWEGHDKLPHSYKLWLSQAQRLFSELADAGKTVVPVDVDLFQFIAWCGRANELITKESLAKYARFKWERRYSQ